MGNGLWTKRNSTLSLAGIKFWRAAWTNSTTYVAGDGVYNSATGASYVCILGHTSNTSNDKPGSGSSWQTYWSVIAQGATGYTGFTGATGYTGDRKSVV